jgi:hypothetical protein
MKDNEKIKMLEKQIELLEKIVELQKSAAPVVIPYYPAPAYPYPEYPCPQPYTPWYWPIVTWGDAPTVAQHDGFCQVTSNEAFVSQDIQVSYTGIQQ